MDGDNELMHRDSDMPLPFSMVKQLRVIRAGRVDNFECMHDAKWEYTWQQHQRGSRMPYIPISAELMVLQSSHHNATLKTKRS